MTEERKFCPFSLSYFCVEEKCMAWQPECVKQGDGGFIMRDIHGREIRVVSVPGHCRLIP